MKLSVIMPVYNEQRTIHEIVARVQAVPLAGIERELVIVDEAHKMSARLYGNEVDKTKEVTRTVMEGAAKLSVPLVVDTGVGANWAAAH